jgi:hypothetical protein
VLGAPPPEHDRGGRRAARSEIFNVFTLRDRRIVRIEDHLSPAEALTAEDVRWR